MIKVLQDWRQIGQATKYLGNKDLPRHITAEKNWDLSQLHTLCCSLDRTARIIDLGCGGLCTLTLLSAMGFENLLGVDLHVSCVDRCRQLRRMWRDRTAKPPFRLYSRDLMRTGFPAASFDLATCISVIEHGVDSEIFLREASRILKPGGLLFVTADYWADPTDVPDAPDQYGQAWRILSRKDIEDFLTLAGRRGFEPYEGSLIPDCADRCLLWQKKEFTAIAVVLRKTDG